MTMIPIREAAKQRKISIERIRQYIRADRIPGAVRDEHFGRYLVPSDFVILAPEKAPRKKDDYLVSIVEREIEVFTDELLPKRGAK